MAKFALGLIEVVGLAAGFEAADAAVKAANVKMLEYELSGGSGRVTIKLWGNVAAIKAAVSAGTAAAKKVNEVWSVDIIARPAEQTDNLSHGKEFNGIQGTTLNLDGVKEISIDQQDNRQEASKEIEDSGVEESETEEVEDENEIGEEDKKEEFKEIEESGVEEGENEEVEDKNEVGEENKEKEIQAIKDLDEEGICNLCQDPNCPRVKWEKRSKCIHYDENEDE